MGMAGRSIRGIGAPRGRPIPGAPEPVRFDPWEAFA